MRCLALFFAGHETTALTLTWLFYQVSQQAEVAQRLYEELEAVLGGRLPIVADLPHLQYTDWVVQETLRLYPPVYVTIREADEDAEVGDYFLPKGCSLLLNIRGLHRHPAYWLEPERFDPLRFSPERADERHKFAFVPFMAGPRKCIGDSFAMMEMKLMVATILQRYRPSYAGKAAPVEFPSFVMQPKEGMLMRLERP